MYQPCFFVGRIRGQVWLRGGQAQKKRTFRKRVRVHSRALGARGTDAAGVDAGKGRQDSCGAAGALCRNVWAVSTAGAPTERWGLGKPSGKESRVGPAEPAACRPRTALAQAWLLFSPRACLLQPGLAGLCYKLCFKGWGELVCAHLWLPAEA